MTGPSSQPGPEIQLLNLRMVPPGHSSKPVSRFRPGRSHWPRIERVTEEKAAACCRWRQRGLKIVGNLNPVPVHSDVKPQEMKAESGDLWKKWQESLLCVQYWLKKIVLPPNRNGFYVFGPILTKTLSSLLTRPCCHGDAGLDAWQKHVSIRQV